jgi:hypothetical protein
VGSGQTGAEYLRRRPGGDIWLLCGAAARRSDLVERIRGRGARAMELAYHRTSAQRRAEALGLRLDNIPGSAQAPQGDPGPF